MRHTHPQLEILDWRLLNWVVHPFFYVLLYYFMPFDRKLVGCYNIFSFVKILPTIGFWKQNLELESIGSRLYMYWLNNLVNGKCLTYEVQNLIFLQYKSWAFPASVAFFELLVKFPCGGDAPVTLQAFSRWQVSSILTKLCLHFFCVRIFLSS